MPAWGWGVIVFLLLVVVAVRLLYGRFQAMCAWVRGELPEFLRAEFPGVEVLGEHLGDLRLRTADGAEATWELADLYASVARIGGLGSNREARLSLYRASAFAVVGPVLDAEHPFSLEAHGDLIHPRLQRAEGGGDGATRELPGLGLAVRYLVRHRGGETLLGEADLAAGGVSLAAVEERALANLAARLPPGALEPATDQATALMSKDAAAAILLAGRHLPPGGSAVALIPHGDMFVFAATPEDGDGLERLRHAALAAGDPHGHEPLLDRPVAITPAGMSLLP